MGRGQARLCWAPGSGSIHNQPAASPPTTLKPSPRNLGAEEPDLRRYSSASVQALVCVRSAAALAFGGYASYGKLAGPRGLTEKEGAWSQVPWQTALIRANDCTSPLPGCFINTAINSSEATSLASRRSNRSRTGALHEPPLLASLAGSKRSPGGPKPAVFGGTLSPVGAPQSPRRKPAQQTCGNSYVRLWVYLAQQPQQKAASDVLSPRLTPVAFPGFHPPPGKLTPALITF